MDEETKKLLQNMAQQQARMAEAANTTIDKKPFTVNLHMVYAALAVLVFVGWTCIGWIKDVDTAMLKSKQAPVTASLCPFLSCLCGSEPRVSAMYSLMQFLSCLCGSELGAQPLASVPAFLSCLCGSER